MPRSEMVQSLLRALDILELVVDAGDGARLNELADKLGLRKSTAHNLARTLVARGYLAKDSLNRYRSGPIFEEMQRRRASRDIFQRAAAAITRLQTLFPHGVLTFSELVGAEICCRLRLAPDTPGGLRRPPDQVFNPFGSASGLCLQAFNADFHNLLAAPGTFEESGRRHWATRDEFEKAILITRQNGLAAVQTGDHWCLAAPVGHNFVLGLRLETTAAGSRKAAATLSAAAQEIAATERP